MDTNQEYDEDVADDVMESQDTDVKEEYVDEEYYEEPANYETTFNEITRFDPKKDSHRVYELKDTNSSKKVKKGEEKDISNKNPIQSYFIDESLKEKLKEGSEFSLLSMFNPTRIEVEERPKREHRKFNVDEKNYSLNFTEPSEPKHEKVWWDQPLFFDGSSDQRLIEGIEFFSTKPLIDSNQYNKQRQEIKQLVRDKLKQSARNRNRTPNYGSTKKFFKKKHTKNKKK